MIFKYTSLKNGNAIFKLKGILNTVYDWSKNSKFIKEWTDGRTADDFVNANMIELKNTGFYYVNEKDGFAKWTKRKVPDWYEEMKNGR